MYNGYALGAKRQRGIDIKSGIMFLWGPYAAGAKRHVGIYVKSGIMFLWGHYTIRKSKCF